jgi:hypothetical protein
VGAEQTSPRRNLALLLGVVTLACVVLLFIQDAAPRLFPAGSHEVLSAISLAAIALAYVVFQLLRRSTAMEMVKTILLALAFLFWAANQFWPNLPQAGLFNDIAIGLFVFDVFLAIAGWPLASTDSLFAKGNKPCQCGCGCCARGSASRRVDPLMD